MPGAESNCPLPCRSSSGYAGSSGKLQHHCQGAEALVQHASRRKWNLGKPWSEGEAFNTSPLVLNGQEIVTGEPYV